MESGKRGLATGDPLAIDQWQPVLDRITRTIEGLQADVEVASMDYGHQRLAENVALKGISFDPRSSLLEIELEGIDHRIDHPRSVTIDNLPHGVNVLQIVGKDGTQTIIHMKEPLMLPEPAGAAND